MKRKIIIGVLLAVFLMLLVPVNSAVEIKTTENHNINLIKEKQNSLIKNHEIKKDALLHTKDIKNIFKNLILIEKLDQQYDLNKQDVSLNELVTIKNDLESSFYILKEFIKKHDLTSINQEIELNIKNAESKLNELTKLIENNPEKLGIIIQILRCFTATLIICFLSIFDIIYIFIYIPLLLIGVWVGFWFFIGISIATGAIVYDVIDLIIRYTRVMSIPFTLFMVCAIVLDEEGKIGFIEAWSQLFS